MSDRPDPPDVDELDEIASAYVDGEATADEAARVATDANLAAAVDAMRAVAEQVAAVGAAPTDQRTAAIARALAAHGAVPEEPSAPVATVVSIDRARRHARILSVAAIALVAVLAVALLGVLAGRDDDQGDAATAALDSASDRDSEATREETGAVSADSAPSSAESGGGSDGAAPTTTLAAFALQLGAVPDEASLAAVARGVLDGDDMGFGGDATVALDPLQCVATLTLEQVLFEARAEYAGVPAEVVAYESVGGARRVAALAITDCGLLADVAL